MSTYTIVVPVESAGTYVNGATVTAWNVSRFGSSNVPTEGTAVPSGTADATATTATGGAPGQAVLTLTAGAVYNICVTSGGVNYWTQTSEALAGGALQASNNLSDLGSASTARTNLGLGDAATSDASAFDAAGSASTAQAASLQKSSNLSDLASVSTARTNLGLGTAATQASTAFDAAGAAATVQANLTAETTRAETAEALAAQKANNLSDLSSASTARTNLGLGDAATHPASDFSGSAAGTSGKPLAATDATVTNARTPTSHASTHASAGSDPVTIDESQVTNLTTDLAAKAPLTTTQMSYVSGASPANTRRSTLSFGACANAPTSNYQDICSRVGFTLPVTPTRCRFRIVNRNVLGTLSSVSGSGTTQTYVVPNSLSVGDVVSVYGCSVAGYNVTNATITAVTSSQFSVAGTTTASSTAGYFTYSPSQSVVITGAWWGTPNGGEKSWAGDFASDPTQVYTGTTQDLSTELVTSWFTPPSTATPGSFQGISFGFTVANDSKVVRSWAPGWTWHGATSTGCASAAGYAAAPSVGTASPYWLPFDIRMEFEFVGSNQIGLFIGDSLTNGVVAQQVQVGKMGPDSSWPQMAANKMGALAINAGINGSFSNHWVTAEAAGYSRFDLSTCVPDFAVIGLGTNDMAASPVLSIYQANILAIISNLQALGIMRIYLVTTPPSVGPAFYRQGMQAGILKSTITAGSLGTVTIVGPVTSTTAQGGVPGGGNPGATTDWYQSSTNFTVTSCTTTNNSPTVTTTNNFLTANTIGVFVGSYVSGTGIPAGTQIKSVDSSGQITLTNNCTASGTVTLTFNCNTCYFNLPASGLMEGPFPITAASGTTTLSLTVSGTTVNAHTLGEPVFVGAEGFRQIINNWILSGVPGAVASIDFADIAQAPGIPAVVAAGNPQVPFSQQNWKYYQNTYNVHPANPALYARWAEVFASSVMGS